MPQTLKHGVCCSNFSAVVLPAEQIINEKLSSLMVVIGGGGGGCCLHKN